uniref:Lipocalin n=1 Tax=Macrostomum lignano TaxID=282301 RepID=A0A1I8GET8_9PLAT
CPPIEVYQLANPNLLVEGATFTVKTTAGQDVDFMDLYHVTNVSVGGINCTDSQVVEVTFLSKNGESAGYLFNVTAPMDSTVAMLSLNSTVNAWKARVRFDIKTCEAVEFTFFGCLADGETYCCYSPFY